VSNRTKKSVKAACEKLWSEVVKVRDKHTCQKCGSQDNLNSHHIYGKKTNALKFNLDNGITLCASCHTFAKDCFEMQPYNKKNITIIINRLGKKKMDELEQLNNAIKFNTGLDDWLKLEGELKDALKQARDNY
jgi:uncharacterized Zn finger protein